MYCTWLHRPASAQICRICFCQCTRCSLSRDMELIWMQHRQKHLECQTSDRRISHVNAPEHTATTTQTCDFSSVHWPCQAAVKPLMRWIRSGPSTLTSSWNQFSNANPATIFKFNFTRSGQHWSLLGYFLHHKCGIWSNISRIFVGPTF